MVNFRKFQEHLFRKTPASVYFCISFFNNLDESATYPDEEDRDYLTKVTMNLAAVTITVKPSVIN